MCFRFSRNRMLLRTFVRHRALLPNTRANETTVIHNDFGLAFLKRDFPKIKNGSTNSRTVFQSVMKSTSTLFPRASPLSMTPSTSHIASSSLLSGFTESRRCFTHSVPPFGSETQESPQQPSLSSLAAEAGDPEEIEMEKISVTYRWVHQWSSSVNSNDNSHNHNEKQQKIVTRINTIPTTSITTKTSTVTGTLTFITTTITTKETTVKTKMPLLSWFPLPLYRKKFLRSHGIPYDSGYTCLKIPCLLGCCTNGDDNPTQKMSNFMKKLAARENRDLTINDTTGFFMCPKCQRQGNDIAL